MQEAMTPLVTSTNFSIYYKLYWYKEHIYQLPITVEKEIGSKKTDLF